MSHCHGSLNCKFIDSLFLCGRMATLLLWVCFPGFNPLWVHPSGRSRQSSIVDSCHLLGVVMLEFLLMWWDLVSGASDLCKDVTVTTTAPGHWSLGASVRGFSGCHRQSQACFGRGAATKAAHSGGSSGRLVVSESWCYFYFVWDALYFQWTFFLFTCTFFQMH